MSRTPRVSLTATVAVVVALLLAACTGPVPDPTPPPTPSPTGEARPTPTPTPTPTLAPDPGVEPVVGPVLHLDAVAALVARPEALELVDTRGRVIAALDYLGSAEAAIASLSAVIGADPVAAAYRGTSHSFPGTRYTWDDVLVVWVDDYPEDRRANLSSPIVWPTFSVTYMAQRIRGIALETSSGVQVGDAWAAAISGIDPERWTCDGLAVEFVEYERQDLPPGRVGVGISQYGAGFEVSNEVTRVIAPVPVTEGCA